MNKALAVGWIVSLFLISLVGVTAEANYTDEEVKEIYKEAYTQAVLEAFEGDGMACVYIAERTKELYELQEVEGYAIITMSHIIPIVKLPNNEYYGGQYQFLYRFTSFNRNWRDKVIYSSWGGNTNSAGGALLKNKIIYDHADVFIDYVFIEELEQYRYLLRNVRNYPIPEGN